MTRSIISTTTAPAAIGSYSQAVQHGNTLYISGQIPLVPETMEVISSELAAQTHQVFKNLAAVCEAAGTSLDNALKLTVYLTDLSGFQTINEIMAEHVSEPFPARAAVEVSALPKSVAVEIDAIVAI